MKYDLIVSDYDGTLTVGNVVPKETLDAIAGYRQAGGKFVVCSGRPSTSVLARVKENAIPCDAVVGAQGATVFLGKRLVFSSGFTGKEAAEILSFIRGIEPARTFCTFRKNAVLYDNMTEDLAAYVAMGPYLKRPKKDLPAFLRKRNERFEKISVIKGEDEDVSAWKKEIEKAFPYALVNSGSKRIMEIVRRGCDKLSSVRRVALLLGVPEEKTATFGDSTNDVPLLSFGYGVAVGNAVEPLKAVAKAVVERVEEKPVKRFIDGVLTGTV